MVLRFETKAVHSGEPRPGIGRAVSLPIFQSSTFEYQGETRYDDILYIRLNNTPNQLAVSVKMAELEGGEAGMVTASGMAAITTSLLTVLEPGTHLLAQRGLYGGTHDFVTHELKRLGIEHDWIAGDDPDSWKGKVQQNTRAIYVESITNPLMEVPRLEEVVSFAREHDLLSLIDNTFATPVNFRPIEIGFDLVLHSATKYLQRSQRYRGGCPGGHSGTGCRDHLEAELPWRLAGSPRLFPARKRNQDTAGAGQIPE